MWTYNRTPELYHYGVVGMHWGTRRSGLRSLNRMVDRQKIAKRRLESTVHKSERTTEKVDKLTTKLRKNGGYITEIGYTMAKRNGQKLSRQLHKDAKLTKKIAKIRSRIESNDAIMQRIVNELPKDQIALGKQIVFDTLKN